MKYRAVFLAGAAAGYILGTRAGRERYEQIKRLSRRVAESPTVQETAGLFRAQAGEMVETARTKIGGKVHVGGGTQEERAPGMHRAAERENVTAPPTSPLDRRADIT